MSLCVYSIRQFQYKPYLYMFNLYKEKRTTFVVNLLIDFDKVLSFQTSFRSIQWQKKRRITYCLIYKYCLLPFNSRKQRINIVFGMVLLFAWRMISTFHPDVIIIRKIIYIPNKKIKFLSERDHREELVHNFLGTKKKFGT